MKWEQHSNEDSYHRLIVEAAWDEIATDYNDIVAWYAKMRLPGFHAGKVPRPVVEQRFRKEIIEGLSRMSAERLGREAMREADTEVLEPLEVTDIECAKGRIFRVHARFLPVLEITLPDLNSLKIIEDGADPRDHLSQMLLELVRFEVPNELVREELGLVGLDGSSPRRGGMDCGREPD